MKKIFFISLFYCFILHSAFSQKSMENSEVDSLLDHSFRYTQINVDTAILLSLEARQLAKQINYKYGYLNSFARLSIAYRFKGMYDLAIEKADSAILLSNNNYSNIEASAYNNLGVCYRMKGEADKALSNYLKAIDVYSTQKDTAKKATVLNSIGVMFMYSDIPQKALQYYKESEVLQMQMKNDKGLADVYNNFAIVYANSGDLDSALLYFKKSLKMEETLGNERGVVESYGNIALVYFMQGNIEKAISMTEEVIEIERKAGNIQGEIASYNSIAEMLNEIGETERALEFLQKALKIALEIDSHTEIAAAYSSMAVSYQKMGQLEKAIESYILYCNQQDSAKSQAVQETITELEAKYKNKENKQLIKIQELTIQEKDASLVAKRNQNIALLFMFLGLLAIGFLLYFNLKNKKKREIAQAIISEQEKGITAVFNAQEEERKRISKDLHDGIGQQLSGLKMAFQKLGTDLKQTAPEKIKELEKLSGILSESADEVRSISHQMMPKALTELGLIEAIEDLLEKSLGISKINYQFEHYGIEERLSERVEISLYRVTQELINNIMKHAKASTVNIQLFKNSGKVILVIEDNGQGFKSTQGEGHGLLNMKSRINSLHGELNLEPSPNSGTLATVRIPIT